MAVAKMKEVVERKLRVVDVKCKEGTRCEVDTNDGHTVITDEPEVRGGTDYGDIAADVFHDFPRCLPDCSDHQGGRSNAL